MDCLDVEFEWSVPQNDTAVQKGVPKLRNYGTTVHYPTSFVFICFFFQLNVFVAVQAYVMKMTGRLIG